MLKTVKKILQKAGDSARKTTFGKIWYKIGAKPRNKPATAKKVINKSVDNFLLTLPLIRAPISPPTASAIKNVP